MKAIFKAGLYGGVTFKINRFEDYICNKENTKTFILACVKQPITIHNKKEFDVQMIPSYNLSYYHKFSCARRVKTSINDFSAKLKIKT